MPMILRRVFAAITGIVLPPLGVYMIRGRGITAYASTAMFLVALCVYFLVAALPGLSIWLLSILFALAVSLFARTLKT